MTSQRYFSMHCPECDDEIEDIGAIVTIASRREYFWGAPCSVDESECEIETLPECPTCKKKTIDEDRAVDYFWEAVY